MPFDGTNFEWDDDVLRRLRIGREKIVAKWSQTTIWSDQGSVCAIGAVLARERVFAFGIPRYWRFWTNAAVRALRHALPSGRHSIVFFNDYRRTTKSDVLQLFDRAIEARIAKLARFSVSSGKSADFVERLLAHPVDAGRPIATGGATTDFGLGRSSLPAVLGRNSVTDTIDMIEGLEKLAAWHRMMAPHAGSDWVWEARLLAAEDLERRAADLREQQAARRPVRPA